MTHERSDQTSKFHELVIQFDEALAVAPELSIESSRIAAETLAAETLTDSALKEKFQRLQTCLQLFEHDRRQRLISGDCDAPEMNQLAANNDLSRELDAEPQQPRYIGRFRLIRQLGTGGFGVVFLAEDPRLRRLVAVKIPRPETLATPDLQRRFVRESQIAARLTHPHLVAIHEAGQAGPVSYQVTAYCAGGNLSHWLQSASGDCQSSDGEPHNESGNPHPSLGVTPRHLTILKQKQLPIHVAVELLIGLADGVQHAHEHGILHRDLKPSNILLHPRGEWSATADTSIVGTVPLEKLCTAFQPMISDFGLAKLFADTDASQGMHAQQNGSLHLTSLAGTPQYMAPEQFDGHVAKIGPATDVYALGAILYEVLAGRPAFAKGSIEMLRLQVAEMAPLSLSEHRSDIPRDLDAICRKCLAKSVSNRYGSAQALADDLRAFRRGDAVTARPWPWYEQLAKWSQRRPAVASLMLVSGLLVLGLLSFSAWHQSQLEGLNDRLVSTVKELETQTISAQDESQRANDQARIARSGAYSANLLRAAERFEDGNIASIGTILQEQRLLPGEADERGFEWHYLWSLGRNMRELQGHMTAAICAASLTPDGKTCFAISQNGTISCWDAGTGVLRETWNLPGKGHTFAKINNDVTRAIFYRNGRHETLPMVVAWDLQQGRELRRHEFFDLIIASAEIAPDGTWGVLGCQTDGISPSPVLLWSINSGEMTRMELPDSFDCPSYGINTVAISPDGQECAVAVHSSNDGLSWLHQLFRAIVGFDAIDAVTSEPGRLLQVPQISEWQCLKTPSAGIEKDLKYSPDGKQLLIAVSNHEHSSIEIWSRDTLQRLDAFHDAERVFDKIAFDTLGPSLAISGTHRDVPADVRPATVDTGESLASRPELTFWNAETKTHHASSYTAQDRIASVEFNESSNTWVIGEDYGRLSLWRPETVPLFRELPGHQPREVWGVAFSPDGTTIYSVGDDRMVRAWNVATGLQTAIGMHHTSLVSCLAVSPDGRWIATGSYDDDVVLWDATSMSVHAVLKGHTHDIRSVAFSVDGTILATAGRDQSIRRWSIPDGRLLSVHDQHKGTIRALTFIGNHKLIQGNAEGQITIHNRPGESEVLRNEFHSEEVHCLTVAPSGLRWWFDDNSVIPPQADLIQSAEENEVLLYGCKQGTVRLLHIPTQQLLLEKHLSANEIRSVAFSPDGRTFAAAGDDNAVHLFHVASGHEVLTFANLPAAVNQITFSPDGQHLAAALHNGTIRIWDAPRKH